MLSAACGMLLVLLLASRSMAQDLKQYSYLCLEANQNLCLGISVGDGLPYYDPHNLLYLQAKNRSHNEEQLLDFKKLRW